MTKLPIISGLDCIKILCKHFGFAVLRRRGSHVTLASQGTIFVTVPLHKELRRGTLQGILEQAGIAKDKFLKYV